jgi:POT family proton-dependent oligopeptide transporter
MRLAKDVVQSWLEQPRQLFGLCLTEMWERFGFVTMTALKLLFLVAPVSSFGLGWSKVDAFTVLAWVSITIYMAPLAGGWISDNLIGAKRAILVGGLLMGSGYLGLGMIPYILDPAWHGGLDYQALAAREGLALGQFTPDPVVVGRIIALISSEAGGGAAAEVAKFNQLYFAQSALLLGAISLVIIGNGLFKPSVSSLVGSLYAPGDSRRDGGFTLFWTCINAGSFLAMLIGGAVGERLGWHLAFFCAAGGMLGGLIVFLWIAPSLPAWKKRPRRTSAHVPSTLSPGDGRRIAAIVLMTGFAVIFNANHGQIFGLIPLFVLEDVNRNLGTFEVPALWITALNPLLILLAAPATAAMWDLLGKRGRNPSFVAKFALALALLALGQGVLTAAAVIAEGPAQASMMWLGIGIVLLSLAEIPLQPIGLAMVTQLAPPKLVSTMIGVWLLNYACAAWLGNMVAARSVALGLPTVFGIGAMSCLVALALLLVMRRSMDAWLTPADADPTRSLAANATSAP